MHLAILNHVKLKGAAIFIKYLYGTVFLYFTQYFYQKR